MRKFMNAAAVLFLVAIFCVQGFGIENPNVRGMVGQPTVPPSTLGGGLYRTPNVVDESGNLVMTGNVAGGKHFRGTVPYSAMRDFRASLGSSSLDSFIRQSVGGGEFQSYTIQPRPYFSRTQTVTGTMAGSGDAYSQVDAWKSGTGLNVFGQQDFPKDNSMTYYGRGMVTEAQRPLYMKPEQMERVLWGAAESRLREKMAAQKKFGEGLSDELKNVDLTQQTKGLEVKTEEQGKVKEGQEVVQKEEGIGETVLGGLEQGGVNGLSESMYTLMRRQIAELEKSMEAFEKTKAEPNGALTSRVGERVSEGTENQTVDVGITEKGEEKAVDLDKMGLLAVKAKGLMKEHKTLASYSEDKFNQYMRLGETYLKEGKFYRAADAYTIASVYNKADPLAYVGKSHALLGAGEYITSAMYLARALEIFPEYALFKLDIVGMTGGKDMLEGRINDIKECQAKNGAGEFEFMLGYVYYQMGRIDLAKQALGSAKDKLPDWKAVAVLKKVVDAAAEQRK